MIIGIVDSSNAPLVPLVVKDAAGEDHSSMAVVDTGFNGWITLPRETISTFGLTWHNETRGILADGESTFLPTFRGTVIWDGQPVAVFIDELESQPLIGMRMLHGFRFEMDTIDGGAVQIERLP